MKKLIFSAVAVTLLAASSWIHASLVGDTVNISRLTNTNTFYSQSKVVGAGVEVDDDTGLFQLDITSDSLVFDSFTTWRFSDLVPPADFYEWRFEDLDWGVPGEIIGLNFIGWDTLGLDTTRVSFTADSVIIDIDEFKPSFWEEGDHWEIQLVTRHIPEPATVLLMGLGLAGLGFARQRRANP